MEQREKIADAIESNDLKIELDTFAIQFLTTSRKGFILNTRNRLGRHKPRTPMPEAKRIKEQRDKEPKKYRVGPGFKPKVGIRNIEQNGNELLYDVIPVTFPTYATIRTPEETEESLAVSDPTGVSMTLFTTEDDGTHKMVLQHRMPFNPETRKGNRIYGDIPGSSVAGLLDGTLDKTREGRGKIEAIDTNIIKSRISEETEQEVGIRADELANLKIVGIAKDKVSIHNEFLLIGTTSLSAQQLEKRKEGLARSRGVEDYDFSENFFVIDATPENIEKLLTQIKTPLPPTHSANFMAAGYSMVLEAQGIEAAKAWIKKVGEGINKNYKEINETVKKYYQNNPEQLSNLKENTPRNPNGYEPAIYTMKDQGLPDTLEEFERMGLIKKEVQKNIEEAYIFDVDGVITVPDSRQFDREVMENIANRLIRGEPVILNTGRSISWVQERIIARLYHAHRLQDKKAMTNLFVVGEKGGTWLTFDGEGLMHEHKDDSISVPMDLQNEIKAIVEERFPKTMFYDHTKHTMVSVEMNEINDKRFEGELSLEQFTHDQIELVDILRKFLKRRNLSDVLNVDPTTIATDVQNKIVGKDFAVRKALSWLVSRGFNPKKFIAVGDSKSDLAMARELHEQGQNVEFVFVGNDNDKEDIRKANLPFTAHFTAEKFNKGTAEFLKREK